MAEKIETVSVLTSGDDTPSINTVVHAVVRTALHCGMKVKGIMRGCSGLLDEKSIDMNARSVMDIINRGGTTLYMARHIEMVTEEGQCQTVEVCKKHGVGGVVTIGGDSSFKGAGKFSKLGINTTDVPEAIDLDIACTEYTIGSDTTVNTVIDATDRMHDTSTSHECHSVIEVMGRYAGYVTLWSGIATGSDTTLIPEHYDDNGQEIVGHIIVSWKHDRKHFTIINAEGIGHSNSMVKRIEAATGIETRTTILGHMQRGGSSFCKDRFYASIMGSKAANLSARDKSNRLAAYRNGGLCDLDIEEVLRMKKGIPAYQLKLSTRLTR